MNVRTLVQVVYMVTMLWVCIDLANFKDMLISNMLSADFFSVLETMWSYSVFTNKMKLLLKWWKDIVTSCVGNCGSRSRQLCT